jgi:hypothetical protein
VRFVKALGFGMALAVALVATVGRLRLVPSTMGAARPRQLVAPAPATLATDGHALTRAAVIAARVDCRRMPPE